MPPNHLFVESLAASFGSPQPPPIQSPAAVTKSRIFERLSALGFLEAPDEHETGEKEELESSHSLKRLARSLVAVRISFVSGLIEAPTNG